MPPSACPKNRATFEWSLSPRLQANPRTGCLIASQEESRRSETEGASGVVAPRRASVAGIARSQAPLASVPSRAVQPQYRDRCHRSTLAKAEPDRIHGGAETRRVDLVSNPI